MKKIIILSILSAVLLISCLLLPSLIGKENWLILSPYLLFFSIFTQILSETFKGRGKTLNEKPSHN
jgi:hypothetical protein